MNLPTRRVLVVLSSACLITACGDRLQFPTLPTATPRDPITEVFAGEVNRNGAVTHPFIAESSGRITATLDSVTPEDVEAIGLSLGTWNGVTCQVLIANDTATPSAQVIGDASGVGNLCVRVYDVGRIATFASYQVTVVHP